MFSPILSELVAREQHNDRLRQAEQRQLAEAASVRQPAARFNIHTYLANCVLAVRHMFKALAHAD